MISGHTAATEAISIVMATYNGSRYIEDQLRSILSQMSDTDELIIVDDGSADDTLDIIGNMTGHLPQVMVYRNEVNLGVIKTLEKGISFSSRNIIFLSDQDDIWVMDRKQKMLRAFKDPECRALLANSTIMLDDIVSDTTFFREGHVPDTWSIWGNFRKNNFIGCCMAFRREVLQLALPFPDTISMHDWWIGSCAIATGKVAYLAEPTLLYRRHASNQSSSVRRPWRKVIDDRQGNARALVELLRRRIARVRQ